jgi:alkylation response protein AidB-like acyl-CoA dehydrogenase
MLNELQNYFIEEVLQFTEKEIEPFVADFDKSGFIPKELFEKVGKKGYLGSMISKEFQGMGLDSIRIGLLNEAFGKCCNNFRGLLTVHGMLAIAIERWGRNEQKSKWLTKLANGETIGAFALTESEAGSDAKSIKTVAVEEKDYFILNGHKKWITMGQIADLFLVMAIIDGVHTAFLVERNTPGLFIEPIRNTIAVQSSMLGELFFKDCKIPKENLVGKKGIGLSHVGLNSLNYGRYTIAWGCVGAAQACLESSIKYSRKRKQFGNPIRKNQLVQKMLTEMIVNVQAARLLSYNAGKLIDKNDPESILATWNAKYFASKIVNMVASDSVQIHGANGISNEYKVGRIYRDVKTMEIIEGTSQIHEMLIANDGIRRYS